MSESQIDTEIRSLKEWLAHWGDGPNWTDVSGATVPVVKASLARLIAEAERSRAALREIRSRILERTIGQSTLISSLTRASIAAIAGDALDGGDGT